MMDQANGHSNRILPHVDQMAQRNPEVDSNGAICPQGTFLSDPIRF